MPTVQCTSTEPAGKKIPFTTHTPSRLLNPTPPNVPHPAMPKACEHVETSSGAASASLGMKNPIEFIRPCRDWSNTLTTCQSTQAHPPSIPYPRTIRHRINHITLQGHPKRHHRTWPRTTPKDCMRDPNSAPPCCNPSSTSTESRPPKSTIKSKGTKESAPSRSLPCILDAKLATSRCEGPDMPSSNMAPNHA